MADTISCQRCQGTMEEGFVMDRSNGNVQQKTWVEGYLESRATQRIQE